jgi:hypothetical protein
MFDTITKEKILEISEYEPERLFSGPDNVAIEYKQLAKRFFPGQPAGDEIVFQHINILRDAAKKKIKSGEWHIPGVLEITGKDDKVYRIKYLKDFDFGLGRAYIANNFVAYLFEPNNDDLIKNAIKIISNFPFPISPIKSEREVRSEFEPRLTKIKYNIDTTKGHLLVLDKPADSIRLLDLLEYAGGSLEPKHVAWILSELYNFCNYLEKTNLTHNDLSLDTIYVIPQMHSAHIIGGWWYSSTINVRMQKKQSGRTVAYAPRSVLTSKLSDIKTDLELVKLTGRELLGDESGSKLITSTTVPKALVDWIRVATTGKAITDYKLWQDVLTQSFGPRRFTELKVKSSDVYK